MTSKEKTSEKIIDEQINTILKYSKSNKETYCCLRSLRNKSLELLNHSDCPLCKQTLSFLISDNDIQKINSLINFYGNKMNEDRINFDKKMKPILKKQEIEKDIHKKNVLEFLELNKKKMNKAIRDFRNPKIEKFLLPHVTETKLWNEAIEIHFDNRCIEEIEDLYFE